MTLTANLLHTYQFSVAVVVDPQSRSKDLVATGAVKRVELTKELSTALARTDDVYRIQIYAQGGLWYDAFDAVLQLISANPQIHEFVELRADLLQQVDLDFAS